MYTSVSMMKRGAAGRGYVLARASADLEAGGDDADTPDAPVLDDQALVRRVLPAVLVATLGAFSFGYHLGIVNPALEHIARDLGIAADAQLKGLVVSVLLIGATVGSLVAGKLADKHGRKTALMAVAVPLLVGSLLCACAPVVSVILIGRLLAGLGIGACSNLVPMYISEIAPEKARGTLGSLNQLMVCIGILVAVVAGLPLADDPNHWHGMFLFGAVPAAAQFFLMSVVPESPGWFRRRGDVVAAEAAETALWGAPDATAADSDVGDDKGEKEASFAELFAPANRKQIVVGSSLFFLQQMSGINAVIYFSSSMFASAGVTDAVAASVGVTAINVFGTIISGQFLDRMGRKPLLIGSFIGMAASCVVIAAAMSSTATFAGTLAVAGTLAYMVSFGIGCGPIPGLLSSEIFSPRVKGSGMSLCLVTHWVFNFVIGQAFLPVVEAVGGPAVFVGFGCVCVAAALFVQTRVLETKGKTLDAIQREMLALQ